MNIIQTAAAAGTELSNTLGAVKEEEVLALLHSICGARKIYVCGAGRSLLMLRGLAMRLMHVGLESYVVGDTTTPAFEEGDLLILGSGSGETSGLINVARKARSLGGKIAVITVKENSTLGTMADILVKIPAFTDKVPCEAARQPILPGGSMFEQCMLVLGDAMVLPLAKMRGVPTDRPFKRHANLE